MEEIVRKCNYGIDLHTGNLHSENLPHIRINPDVRGTLELAKAFNTPVILHAKLRDGSLREAATALNVPVIVYEGGEALRFNELAIRMGTRGILNVLHHLGMIKHSKTVKHKKIKSRLSSASSWARSPQSGIFHQSRLLGTYIDKGEKIGYIADPFTKKEFEIFSHQSGIIIGRNTLPLVNEGDALFHIARIKGGEEVSSDINDLNNYYLDDFLDYD
jgi:predicted deacylase